MKASHNNTIDARERDYLYIQVSQIPNSGNGLYTAIDIFKDETISLFKGEILSAEKVKKCIQENRDQYFINLPDGNILDSINVNCFAKFANDAGGKFKSKFRNNSLITLDENNNVCIEALRDIKANEEIFCSYGKKYWKKHG